MALKCSISAARSRQVPEVCATKVDANRGSMSFQFLALISCHSRRSNCSAPVALLQVLTLGWSQHPVSASVPQTMSNKMASRARMVGDCNPASLVMKFPFDIGPEFLEDVPSHIAGDTQSGAANRVIRRATAARIVDRAQRRGRSGSQEFGSIKG